MKNFYIQIWRIVLFQILLCAVLPNAIAKDKPTRVYMYLNYFNDDGNNYLEAELKYKQDKEFYQLEDVEVTFLSIADEDHEIAKITTGVDGKAICKITDDTPIFRDEDGIMKFKAVYQGNDKYKKARKTLEAVMVEMALQSTIVDSVKTVIIEGLQIISDSLKKPLTAVPVIYNVKRLFGDMIIGENNMKDGKSQLDFPTNIPGDQDGNLSISAKIVDHELYGNVRVGDMVQWGIPVSHKVEKLPRALWSNAPVWMIIAMIVIVAGAWYHYFLALHKLFKMKKS